MSVGLSERTNEPYESRRGKPAPQISFLAALLWGMALNVLLRSGRLRKSIFHVIGYFITASPVPSPPLSPLFVLYYYCIRLFLLLAGEETAAALVRS